MPHPTYKNRCLYSICLHIGNKKSKLADNLKTNTMKNLKLEALILAVALVLMGGLVGRGLNSISEGERVITVKGLAEKEIPADKVTWPLVYHILGNDLNTIYEQINADNQTIVGYLKESGITDEEISINAPEITDKEANIYDDGRPMRNRYNVTSIITVTSKKIEIVRKLIANQKELLKKGIAIVTQEYSHTIKYEFTSLNEIKPDMIEEATKNARMSAEKFAKDSESELGKIKCANQGQFVITDRDETTPHIKKVRVVTTIEYLLED